MKFYESCFRMRSNSKFSPFHDQIVCNVISSSNLRLKTSRRNIMIGSSSILHTFMVMIAFETFFCHAPSTSPSCNKSLLKKVITQEEGSTFSLWHLRTLL
mmetsp:Transcript_13720/g.20904  ORF Transcript_13720/g.20904 Transcript_13720/m.20904 type:complete len:100 (-) Transcript_13720:204-503(-)